MKYLLKIGKLIKNCRNGLQFNDQLPFGVYKLGLIPVLLHRF